MESGFKKVKGFRDIFGDEISIWQGIERISAELFCIYGFKEVKLPVLEVADVFRKGLGNSTDIVEKEMFSFVDKDGQTVALRPEGTASIVRFFIENKLYMNGGIHKFYYYGPMFRREKPQKGRYRQFYQIGVEAIGSDSPLLDAEVVKLFYDFFDKTSVVKEATLEINSVGCFGCRPEYIKVLKSYLLNIDDKLCENCRQKILINPLRVLDCKNKMCKIQLKGAPLIQDYLCACCKDHFNNFVDHLNVFGVNFEINYSLVRGLDYYTRTAFEMVSCEGCEHKIAIGAGGRYNGLVKGMGGPDIPGIGFAIGVDRLVSLLQNGSKRKDFKEQRVFIAYTSEKFEKQALAILQNLRENGIVTLIDYEGVNLKSQLKNANRAGADYCLILGEEELEKKEIIIKDMQSGCQNNVKIDKVADFLRVSCTNGGGNCYQ